MPSPHNEFFACICSSTWPVILLFHNCFTILLFLLFGDFELHSGVLRSSHHCLVCELLERGAREEIGENIAHPICFHLERYQEMSSCRECRNANTNSHLTKLVELLGGIKGGVICGCMELAQAGTWHCMIPETQMEAGAAKVSFAHPVSCIPLWSSRSADHSLCFLRIRLQIILENYEFSCYKIHTILFPLLEHNQGNQGSYIEPC